MIVLGLVLSMCFVWLLVFAFVKGRLTRISHTSKSSAAIASTSSGMPDDASGPPMFQDGWLTVNGLSSHILTWGGWVEDPLPEGDSVLVFMCGVPGITLFYKNFLESLYKHMKIPVWTICIAGHELPPSYTNLQLPDNSELYNNVAAQVAHKKAFVTDFVPQNRKLYLIGHSFGTKMVTELLKEEEIRSRTEKCVLIMPTLERFGDTPRAQYWLKCKNTGFIYTYVFLIWIVHWLPAWCRQLFCTFYFHSRGYYNINDGCVEAMIHFCNPTIFYNVRTLVYNELEAIKQLDIEVLTDSRDKLKIYFAQQDYWAPLTHYETLKSAVPKLSIEILDDKFEHAFSLGTAQDMADIVVKDLKPDTVQPTHKTITQTDSEGFQDRVKKYLKAVGFASSEQASEKFKSLKRQLSMKIMTYRMRDSSNFPLEEKLYDEQKSQSIPSKIHDNNICSDDNITETDSKEPASIDHISRIGNYKDQRKYRSDTDTYEKRLNYSEEKNYISDVDLFFASVSRDVKNFPRKLQNKVKRDVLNSILQVDEEQQCYLDDNTLPLYSWNSTLHSNQSSTAPSSVGLHVSTNSRDASDTYTSSSKSSLMSNKLNHRNQKSI